MRNSSPVCERPKRALSVAEAPRSALARAMSDSALSIWIWLPMSNDEFSSALSSTMA